MILPWVSAPLEYGEHLVGTILSNAIDVQFWDHFGRVSKLSIPYTEKALFIYREYNGSVKDG